MKRPVITIGFTFLFTLTVAGMVGFRLCIAVGVFALIASIGVMFLRKMEGANVTSLILLSIALACGCFSIRYYTEVIPAENLEGCSAHISGSFSEEVSESNGKYVYFIETDSISIDGAPQNIKILISSKTYFSFEAFDKIEADVTFYKLGDGLDSFSSEKIYIRAYFDSVSTPVITPVDSSEKPFYYKAICLRNKVKGMVNSFIDSDSAGLVNAMLVGDKSGMSNELIDAFRVCGISHIIVVSGMHLAFAAWFFSSLLSLFGLNRRISAVITLPFIFLFMMTAGFSTSVVRAGIMCSIYLIGTAIMRESDKLNSLAVSILLMLLYNPFYVNDIGFMLSVFSTLGLVTSYSPVNRAIISRLPEKLAKNRVVKKIIDVTVSTLVATFFNLPILIVKFKSLSVIAPLANLIVFLPVNVIICGGIASFFLWLIPGVRYLCYPVMLVVGLIAKGVNQITLLLTRIPFANVSVSNKTILLCIGFSMLILALCLWLKKNGSFIRIWAVSSIFLLIIGIISYNIFGTNLATVTAVDCYDGFCTVISCGGKTVVIGSGSDMYSARSIYYTLADKGIDKIDILIIPDNDKVYSGGAFGLLKLVDTDRVICPEGKISQGIESFNSSPAIYPLSACELSLGDKIKTSITENGTVLVYINDYNVAVPPADGSMDQIPSDTDIIVSTAVRPGNVCNVGMALICGELPDTQICEGYYKISGITAYSTSGYGDITVKIRNNREIKVRREE